MTREDDHRHHREEDVPRPLKIMDGVYKGAKLVGMAFVTFLFFATIRERLQAIPVIQDDIRSLKVESSSTREQMAYLVGGMESMTGRRFRPSQPR